MWSLVNLCPDVFVSLSMIYLCIYSPVCSVWFLLVYSLLPVLPVCQLCLVLIKDCVLSLRPRLRVPVSSLLCAPWHIYIMLSFCHSIYHSSEAFLYCKLQIFVTISNSLFVFCKIILLKFKRPEVFKYYENHLKYAFNLSIVEADLSVTEQSVWLQFCLSRAG